MAFTLHGRARFGSMAAGAMITVALFAAGLPAYAADDRTQAVRGLYQSLLCREPDDAGLRSWVDSSLSLDQVQGGITASPEGQRMAAVRLEYQSLLSRDPIPGDCAGLRSWVASPWALLDVHQAILASREYQSSVGAPADFLVRLNPDQRQFPESIAVGDDAAYVSLSSLPQVLRVTFDGRVSVYATLPTGQGGQSNAYGLRLEPSGELLVVYHSTMPGIPGGIYRVPPGGGEASLFARADEVNAADLTRDAAGNLYMTDSRGGAIFRAGPEGGEMERWLQHPLLTGEASACLPAFPAGPLGANGIAVTGSGDLLVNNTTKATVVRVPMNPDGSAGEPRVYAGPDCHRMQGIDGMALDPEGNLYLGANFINRITKITPDGRITVLESGGVLDFPSSVALGIGPSNGDLFIANFAARSVRRDWPAHPGILRKSLLNEHP
jgi:hypothetical protein